jgi:hypothetical protein
MGSAASHAGKHSCERTGDASRTFIERGVCSAVVKESDLTRIMLAHSGLSRLWIAARAFAIALVVAASWGFVRPAGCDTFTKKYYGGLDGKGRSRPLG